MQDEIPQVVDKMLDYLYTGDYTEVFNDLPPGPSQGPLLPISALQLHAKIFDLGDKYDIQALCGLAVQKYSNANQAKFDAIEYLDSIPDVFSSPLAANNALEKLAIIVSRDKLRAHLENESVREKYEFIIAEVPDFAIGLLDTLWKPVYSCWTCGDLPWESANKYCGKCGQNRAGKIFR